MCACLSRLVPNLFPTLFQHFIIAHLLWFVYSRLTQKRGGRLYFFCGVGAASARPAVPGARRGRAPYGAGVGWRSVTRRGLAFSPPSPQPPSRREGGDYKFISPGAAAPGTPASNRLRHLQFPPCRCLAGSWFLQHGFPLPRRVPVPRQSPKNQFSTSIASAARVQPRGCKGRSPLHKKTKNLPLPAGKGAGGMGAESKLKAWAAGDIEGKPPAGWR